MLLEVIFGVLPRLYTQVIQKNFEDYSVFST